MLTGQVMQDSQASMPFPSCTALTSPCSSGFTFHILDLITHDVHGKHSLFSSYPNQHVHPTNIHIIMITQSLTATITGKGIIIIDLMLYSTYKTESSINSETHISSIKQLITTLSAVPFPPLLSLTPLTSHLLSLLLRSRLCHRYFLPCPLHTFRRSLRPLSIRQTRAPIIVIKPIAAV